MCEHRSSGEGWASRCAHVVDKIAQCFWTYRPRKRKPYNSNQADVNLAFASLDTLDTARPLFILKRASHIPLFLAFHRPSSEVHPMPRPGSRARGGETVRDDSIYRREPTLFLRYHVCVPHLK